MNPFIDHEIPHDIFSEILSHLYSGPLKNNVINLFWTSKVLRETYMKEFCNYIRFQQVPPWIPNEYIKHGRRQDEKIEREELEHGLIFFKRRKVESTETDIISSLRDKKIQLTSYKVDRLTKDDDILKEYPLKELYIKETAHLPLFKLKVLKELDKLVIEDLLDDYDFHSKISYVDNFPNLKYIKIDPRVCVDGYKLPQSLKEIVFDEVAYPINPRIKIELPENLEVLRIGSLHCGFKNFPKSIKTFTYDKLFQQNDLPVPEHCEIESFFKETPIIYSGIGCECIKCLSDIESDEFCYITYDDLIVKDVMLRTCHFNYNCISSTIEMCKRFGTIRKVILYTNDCKVIIYSDENKKLLEFGEKYWSCIFPLIEKKIK